MVLPVASSRQVLVWSLPTLAFVLSILWYRRRNRGPKPKTDPGGNSLDHAVDNKTAAAEKVVANLKSPLNLTATDKLCSATEKKNKTESALDLSVALPTAICNLTPLDIADTVTPTLALAEPASASDKSVDIVDIELISTSLAGELESKSEVTVQQEKAVEIEVKQDSLAIQKFESVFVEATELSGELSEVVGSFEVDTEPVVTPVIVSDSLLVTKEILEPVTEVLTESLAVQVTEEISVIPVTPLESLQVTEIPVITAIKETSQVVEETSVPEATSPGEENFSSATMTEVEEQSVVASQGDSLEVAEAAAPPVLSKISVDVSSTQPNKTEEDEDVNTKTSTPQQPRDSANHSPAEAMLASPSISNDSDTHSVGSNDSGKGGSDVTTPVVEEEVEGRGPGKKRTVTRGGSRRTSTSSRSSGSSEPGTSSHTAMTVRPHSVSCSSSHVPSTPSEQDTNLTNPAVPCIYEFVIPQQLVGRLIGKHGCFVQQIKCETNSSIYVKRHPESAKFKVCAIEGTQTEIEGALKLIRKKFPVKKYPSVSLERVVLLPPVVSYPLIPEALQMYLVECVNNDVILSSLVSAGHMFLQQPTHPTFPMLSRLIMSMTQCYSEEDSPTLPNLAPGIVCAAPSQGSWYRAEVIDVRTATAAELEERDQEDNEEITVCDIKFVDYGGYMTLPSSELRQIRTDFMMLPFQATECYLADITWLDGEEGWSTEATQCVEDLSKDQVLQAQVVGYADNCIPFIRLFSISGHMAMMVNQILVHRGLAKPLLE